MLRRLFWNLTVPSAFPNQHVDYTYIEELSVCVFLLESMHGNALIENIPVPVGRNYVENGRNQISLPFFYLQLVSFIYDSIPGSLSNHTVDIEVI